MAAAVAVPVLEALLPLLHCCCGGGGNGADAEAPAAQRVAAAAAALATDAGVSGPAMGVSGVGGTPTAEPSSLEEPFSSAGAAGAAGAVGAVGAAAAAAAAAARPPAA